MCLLRLVGEMEKGGDGFDVEDEYDRFRRYQEFLITTIIMSFVLSGSRPRSPVFQASADNNS